MKYVRTAKPFIQDEPNIVVTVKARNEERVLYTYIHGTTTDLKGNEVPQRHQGSVSPAFFDANYRKLEGHARKGHFYRRDNHDHRKAA